MSKVFKCESCGADLDFQDSGEIVQCPYCGTRQTLYSDSYSDEISDEQRRKIDSLLKRVFILLEDGEFKKADKYCERVLDVDPENALAYLGKLMAEKRVNSREDLADCEESLWLSNNYYRSVIYAESDLKSELESYEAKINARLENKKNERDYNYALSIMKTADNEDALRTIANMFMRIKDYKNSYSLAQECINRADEMKREREKFAEEDRIAREKIEIQSQEQAKTQAMNETINKFIIFLLCAGICALVYFTSK